MDVQAEARIIRSNVGVQLFVVDGSRLFDIDENLAAEIEASSADSRQHEVIAALVGEHDHHRYISENGIAPPKLRSISLNVAQACNMSCGYCYADRGRFGGSARLMKEEVARLAVDKLIEEAPSGSDLVIGFMGGEPFVNRPLIHAIAKYADREARSAGHRPRFSLTTNATLLTEEDAALLCEFPFSVTVSLDGDASTNDRQRQLSGEHSAYSRAVSGLQLLTKCNRPRHLSIRATVSPVTGPLLPLLEHFFSLGVDEAGFAPVLSAPDGFPTFSSTSFGDFTSAMIACGKRSKESITTGQPFPFSNFETALHEIHRGTHRPYPQGNRMWF